MRRKTPAHNAQFLADIHNGMWFSFGDQDGIALIKFNETFAFGKLEYQMPADDIRDLMCSRVPGVKQRALARQKGRNGKQQLVRVGINPNKFIPFHQGSSIRSPDNS